MPAVKRTTTTTLTKRPAKRTKVITGGFVRNPVNRREIKRIYEALSFAVASPTLVEEVGDVAQGDTSGTRDGRAVQQLYTDVVVLNDRTDNVPIRVIIFKWTNALTPPTAANILTATTGVGGYNINYEGSYKILSDRIVHSADENMMVKYRVKHSFTQTYYSTLVANVADSHMYVLVISGDGTTSIPTSVQVGLSTSYYDI